MAVNKGRSSESTTPNSSWTDEEAGDNGLSASVRQDTTGLSGLFSLTSMTSDNRNMVEVSEVAKILKERFTRIAEATTPEAQRNIVPNVDEMTAGISSILPGLVLHKVINNKLWVMGVLFSNKDLTISSEPIRINTLNGIQQQISVPLTPTNYANEAVMKNLVSYYTRVAEQQGAKGVEVINMVVVDLEMLNHPEAGDPKDRPGKLAGYLTNQWETGVLVRATIEIASAGVPLPSPFADPKHPFGKDGCAEARVTAIQERVTKAFTLSAANMEVVAATISDLNRSGGVSSQNNSKEIARATAIVSLAGITMQAHQANLAASRGAAQHNDLINQFLNLTGGVYPHGYRPLHPVITMETAYAGEMMNFNQGLFPFFFGLYLLMTTNTDYVFSEALRKVSVGQRGNLSALEPRIDSLLGGVNPPNRLKLNDKNITDIDVVNQWIRQNVSQHAIFRSNIVLNGPDSAINNFLSRLSQQNRSKEVGIVVSVIDAMTKNKFSQIIEQNRSARTGWTPEKPVLHRTPILVVNGLAEAPNGKKLNTLEVDEMLLGHYKGANGAQAMMNYLAVMYGVTNEDPKARCQKLNLELNQSLFNGAVHINSYSQAAVWDPNFMAALAQAMESLGSMNAANSAASFRPNQAVYVPGAGLATTAFAGGSSLSNPNLMNAFLGGFAFG
ncbi:TPA: hypothetical protein RG892_000386 [Pseudomonas aeruginosa]|nr:hypothetical protein [Pseudomonas aeruginosa]